MEAHDLENKLGKFQVAYTSRMGKIAINIILVLIWFFLGYFLASMLWDFYKSRVTAVIVGLVFLASGAAYVIIPYRRRAGRKARLYEEGIWISIRGQAQSWRFDEIDGVSVISGQDTKMAEGLSEGIAEALPVGGLVGGLIKGLAGGALQAAVPTDKLVGTDINGYQFYIGEVRAFDIGPEYKQWKELGAAVFAGVMERLVPRLVDRLAQGEKVVFDKLTAGGLGRTRLTLTQKGLQEKEKDPLPWTDVVEVSEEKTPGFATVEALERKKNVTFGIDSTLNALVALQVIKAMTKDARTSQG